MAYIDVAEWSPDQVTDWLKGLDKAMYKYVNAFANNEVKGQMLLNIRPYELVELGMKVLGHQEIVLGAVEQLQNFNYGFEKENLQYLAMRVATTAKNLHHQLADHTDKSKVETQILYDITRAIATIKPLVAWLDRSPFQGQVQFNEIRKQILRLGIEMATSAHRDRFVENPVDQIRLTAQKLSKLADYIIQDISDPIILQPATLNVVTIKKRESDLGFNIRPNYHGIHVITDIKCNSTAHISGKIEDGDEIIQINFQTVIGWHYERVLLQLQESSPDVLLTLKKRPRHTKIYGQIYMKPYRLPSKKRAIPYRFGENLPSPRLEPIPAQLFPVPPLVDQNHLCDSDSSSSSSILGQSESANTEKDMRLFLPKSRAVLQRRNTICGDQASGYINGNIKFLQEINVRPNVVQSNLRDKSVSFGFGLENATRPTTSIHDTKSAHDKFGDKSATLKGSLPDMKTVDDNVCKPTTTKRIDDYIGNDNAIGQNAERKRHFDPSQNKAVKFNATHDVIDQLNGRRRLASNANVGDNRNGSMEMHTTQIDNYKLDSNKHGDSPKLPLRTRLSNSGNNEAGLAEAVNTMLIKNQNEKATDMQTSRTADEDKPPEINPRKEFLTKIAPKPPPRPSKAAEILQRKFESLRQDRSPNSTNNELSPLPNPDPYSAETIKFIPPTHLKPSDSTITDKKSSSPLLQRVLTPKIDDEPKNPLQTPPKPMALPKPADEEYELLTPNKTKTLTLKKKNSLWAKRRKICLKTLEISDIQGHLFRRIRDKLGASRWVKLYFVLVETVLYGFRTKKSTKAHCMIFLPGYTISLAKEVHSKQFAYKVYHPKKTFYFAAESEQALSQWMDYIKRATLKGPAIDPTQIDSIDIKDLFSETDTSDDECNLLTDAVPQTLSFKQSFLSGCKMNAKKRGSVDETAPATQTKSDKYHLGFGSLKKFAPFSSNKSEKEREEKERKKAQSDVPVPTSRFRSYRKIPGNAGMQVGSSTMQIDYNLRAQMAPQNMPSPLSRPSIKQSPVTPEPMLPKPNDSANAVKYSPSPSIGATHMHSLGQNPIKSLSIKPADSSYDSSPNSTLQTKQYMGTKSTSKLAKQKTLPFNYMHASNPNLVEFSFPAPKTLDVDLPKVSPSNAVDPHQNAQGLITLMDLMLQCEKDEARNLYDNRVNAGVEKPIDSLSKRKHRPSNDSTSTYDDNENTPQNGQRTGVNKIQSRSLPKTPDYAQSFKTDDSEIILARTKEGQKLRDFGYEFISGDDMNSTSTKSSTIGNGPSPGHSSSSSSKSNIASRLQPAFLLPSKRKGLNWISLNSDKRHDDEKLMNKGNFKLVKNKSTDAAETKTGKSDNYRPILNRFVQAKSDNANDSVQLSTFHGNQPSAQSGDSLSAGYGERKNASSSAASYLSKLSFSASKTAKEKRLLGSPRLHRAASSLFGRKNADTSTAVDHESFSPFGPVSNAYGSTNHAHPNDSLVYATHNNQRLNDSNASSGATAHSPHFIPVPASPMIPISEQMADFPSNFESESHSLGDANASSRLVRRTTFNNHNNASANRHHDASNDNNNNSNNAYYPNDSNRANNAVNNAASGSNNNKLNDENDDDNDNGHDDGRIV